jgi:tyrosinase
MTLAIAPAQPQTTTPLSYRKSVELLRPQQLQVLRRAYRASQAQNDDRGFNRWAGIHGLPLPYSCQHHTELFLPWHRAYLYFFELSLKRYEPTVTLPWWDWTSASSHQIGIPAAFAAGPANPLASGPVPAGLHATPPHTTRSPGPPSQLPTQQTVDGILALSSFDDFTSQLQNQHDLVHGWTGGDMGSIASSAFDPIFWSHHCMIDRLWYLWQVKHGVDNIPPSYLDRPLAPWALTVKDVLDVRKLGYTYGLSRVQVPAANFTATAATN